MSALAFFPWLRARDVVELGAFRLVPYPSEEAASLIAPKNQTTVGKLLAAYRDGEEAHPAAVLLQLNKRNLDDDLSDADSEELFTFGEILAFAGLSARRFFSQIGYQNRHNFELTVQRFGDTCDVSTTSRRRDGRALCFHSGEWFRERRPAHVPALSCLTYDGGLLAALLLARDTPHWEPLFDAISVFGLANTDSPVVRDYAELVLATGAFERLFGCNGNAHSLANAFRGALTPATGVNPTACRFLSRSQGQKSHRPDATIREIWIRDLFRARNGPAHGRITGPRGTAFWSDRTHLLLAAFVFPLAVKRQLALWGRYVLTHADSDGIEAFERLAALSDPFLDTEAHEESVWQKTLFEVRRECALTRMVSQLEASNAAAVSKST